MQKSRNVNQIKVNRWKIYNLYIILLMEQFQFSRCEVKSKYFNEWQYRTISLHPSKNVIGISHQDGREFKYFKLSQIKVQQKTDRILNFEVANGRIYEVRGQNIRDILDAVHSHKILSELGTHCQMNTICRPKCINYLQFIKNQPLTAIKNPQIMVKTTVQPQKDYKRQKSYYKEVDWALNPQDGGLILISQQKKRNLGKIIKFVLKKFITTGAFMGISYPVFAMKPESILETYCKSISAAPLIFAQYKRCPVERMKQFVCFCFTFSRLFTDMDKPFNPIIGQTFQAQIAGGTYSAEQTSHHPPQSSIYFQGKGYKIYATLELVAQIGINSASGMVQGDIVIEFEQGGKIVGRSLRGDMSGFLVGQNRFRPDGSCYSYDPQNNLVCMYKRTEKDIFRGYVGKLKQNQQNEFQRVIRSKERFTDLTVFQANQYVKIQSEMEVCWSHYVKFDQKLYFDFNDSKLLPYEPSSEGIKLLNSDSRHRSDIKLREENKIEEAQQEKERIEEQQRTFRKLRANYGKKNMHKKS